MSHCKLSKLVEDVVKFLCGVLVIFGVIVVVELEPVALALGIALFSGAGFESLGVGIVGLVVMKFLTVDVVFDIGVFFEVFFDKIFFLSFAITFHEEVILYPVCKAVHDNRDNDHDDKQLKHGILLDPS